MADETDEEKPAEEAPKKSSKLFSPKNIGILVGMLVLVGGGAFFGIKTMIDKKAEKEQKALEVKIVEEKKVIGFIESFEPIVVNVAGTSATRYLKVTVNVEMEKEEVQAEIKARKLQLADVLNAIFSSKPMKEIADPTSRNAIKSDIRDQINAILLKGEIRNVFFSDFVIQ